MSRETWGTIKQSKLFYINTYRRGLTTLIISLLLSCLFGLLIIYVHVTEPERDFYATSGVTPPIMLQPLKAPNYSSQALLPPDTRPESTEEKLIPQ